MRMLSKAAAIVFAVVIWAAASAPVYAGNISYTADSMLIVPTPDVNLTILSGSTADSLVTGLTSFTVVVADRETFRLRWSGPNPGLFANDRGLPSCTYSGGNNVLTVNGPLTVTVIPDTGTECVRPPSSGNSSGTSTLPDSIFVLAPNGGETFTAGQVVSARWSTSGTSVLSVRLTMSTDGGTTYAHTIATSEPNDGMADWTVPLLSTTKARIKMEALSYLGAVQATDVSDADFTILADTTTVPEDVAAIVGDVEDISADKDLVPETPENDPLAELCGASRLVKSPSATAVYYCGKDGKRYVFPHQHVYLSWYPDFSGVVTITETQLASLKIGGVITYKPGTRMVKIQSDPKVYLVGKGGLLRWIASEEVARALYGDGWNSRIDDINVAFFVSYVVGDPVTLEEVLAARAAG